MLAGCAPLAMPRILVVDRALIALLQLLIEHNRFRSTLDLQQIRQAMVDILQDRKWNIPIVGVRRHAKNIHAAIGVNAQKLNAFRFVLCVQLFQPWQILSGNRTFRPQKNEHHAGARCLDEMIQRLRRGIDGLQTRPLYRLRRR